jgi:hypothetical protein
MNAEHLVEWELAGDTGSTGIKPAFMALCPPQIPSDLTWDTTQTAAMGNWRQLYSVKCNNAQNIFYLTLNTKWKVYKILVIKLQNMM